MSKRPREYHRPTHLTSALELLRQPNTRPLILGPRVPENLYAGAESVVDVSRLGLNYIRSEDEGVVRIGGLTPLGDVADSPVIQAYASGVLAEAARTVVASGLREVVTLGGAWPSQAGPPEVRLALDALRAEPVLEHTLLLEIKLPPLLPGSAGALERLARTPRDEALVAVVVMIHGLSTIQLCVGPAPYYRLEIPSGERSPALEGWQPSSDFRASAEYRHAMARVLARRALATARQRSLENH